MNIKDIQQRAREEFRKTYEDDSTITGLNQFTFDSYGEIVRHIRDNFIDTLIEKTVQMTEESIVGVIENLEIPPHTLNRELGDTPRSGYKKAKEEIISLITNKSDINKLTE